MSSTAPTTDSNLAVQVEALEIKATTTTATPRNHYHYQHHLLRKYSSGEDEVEEVEDDNEEPRSLRRSPVTHGPSPAVDHSHGLARLLKNNLLWSKAIRERQPDFFDRGSKGQQPEVFWIGCSDSRVPENEVLQLAPGEVFTHRNIANVVISTDLNCLSVLQYAVDVLKVKHVIVCGHYGCGGVAAALSDQSFGLIDHWLANIKDVKRQHDSNIDSIQDQEERCRALVEINCRNSVLTVAKSPIMKAAWARGQVIDVVGMVYDIQTGFLSELGYHVSNEKDLKTHLSVHSDALFAARKNTQL
ncbi:hypothetical protein BGZ99_002935 [Dissophora globulifera]|uniref:Carbonic anhydrase n=1 Tax=Dissophora globulifera TaxID=979702 RepID=A0A9P6RLV2_9FUNG|nr:hypothetical protein BGZ99_002935 [Dissophora globulifera]